jgi:hypothetical protein
VNLDAAKALIGRPGFHRVSAPSKPVISGPSNAGGHNLLRVLPFVLERR